VTDIRMPPTNSTEELDVARVIRDELPATGVLVLSAHVELEHAMDLLIMGKVSGISSKGESPT
jgi:YesN/AraC family two-component response regulator